MSKTLRNVFVASAIVASFYLGFKGGKLWGRVEDIRYLANYSLTNFTEDDMLKKVMTKEIGPQFYWWGRDADKNKDGQVSVGETINQLIGDKKGLARFLWDYSR